MKHKKPQTSKLNNLWLGILAALILGGVAWVSNRVGSDSARPAPAAQFTIETKSPAMFTGKTREAYQAAKDVPQVLAQMPCYCGCMQNSGHQHNLHCFMDDHGAT